ncbi:PrsW family intramembrane metalloprotease [bacterium]|nr:PrsW family intramembrane metalloprotease [bacterium]
MFLLEFYLLPLFLAIICSTSWLVFFYFYTPKKTTKISFLFESLFFGICLGIITSAVEFFLIKKIFFLFNISPVLFTYFQNFKQIIIVGIFSFLIIAPIEELFKFLFLIQFFFKRKNFFDQIVDGIKIGVWFGLGFVLTENYLYFLNHFWTLPFKEFFWIFLVRLFISTLAHALYGSIAGYYLILSRFSKEKKDLFLKEGVLACLLFHGSFNFLLFTPFSLPSLFLLSLALIIVIIWFHQKRNLEFKNFDQNN